MVGVVVVVVVVVVVIVVILANSCQRLQLHSDLDSIDVMFMSCKVNFHLVQSALQNLIYLISTSLLVRFPTFIYIDSSLLLLLLLFFPDCLLV